MLTVLVVQEVTTTLVGYERKNVPHNHPPGSSVTYGGYIYSMLLLSACGMRATKIFKTMVLNHYRLLFLYGLDRLFCVPAQRLHIPRAVKKKKR